MEAVQEFNDGLLRLDSWLSPFREAIEWRQVKYRKRLAEIEKDFGSLAEFAQGHRYLGFNPGRKGKKTGVWYREWAPQALSLALVGDFNGWERFRHPMKKDEFGVWSVFVPDTPDGLRHGQKVKVFVSGKDGSMRDRIPAYIQKVVATESGFTGVYWNPPLPYQWRHSQARPKPGLRIYEAHVGMAQEKEGVGSFEEFRREVLPRIAKQGYNAIQLMAIAHHPLYSSFGYQVSNYFAVSSYLGEPEELKRLIDEAHGLGLAILLDVVHSHSVKNVDDGLNDFDGSSLGYFHTGDRGEHPGWDTKLFDYGRCEVLRFLLSNLRFWLEEYRFDGFRFDGVTSMLYHDHGLGEPFNHYERYFSTKSVDEDAVIYLQLANELVHQVHPAAVTIAEDVSGMPGLARPVAEGGLGFDYRLAMGTPDMWIRLLKHNRDEEWKLEEIFSELTNRRQGEKHIAYAESHDQALVGDKTLAFWLMDKEMYTQMHQNNQHLVIDRGVALHKMIRLLTFASGGEGWLNFMGNEFGHPEWIDFPRPENNHSYFYARRQWSLVDNPELRYRFLNEFDKALLQLDETYQTLSQATPNLLLVDEERKLLVFERGELLFLFNFHPTESYVDLPIRTSEAGEMKLVWSSDAQKYGGFERLGSDEVYPVQPDTVEMKIYLPSRSASVLAKSNGNTS